MTTLGTRGIRIRFSRPRKTKNPPIFWGSSARASHQYSGVQAPEPATNILGFKRQRQPFQADPKSTSYFAFSTKPRMNVLASGWCPSRPCSCPGDTPACRPARCPPEARASGCRGGGLRGPSAGSRRRRARCSSDGMTGIRSSRRRFGSRSSIALCSRCGVPPGVSFRNTPGRAVNHFGEADTTDLEYHFLRAGLESSPGSRTRTTRPTA